MIKLKVLEKIFLKKIIMRLYNKIAAANNAAAFLLQKLKS